MPETLFLKFFAIEVPFLIIVLETSILVFLAFILLGP